VRTRKVAPERLRIMRLYAHAARGKAPLPDVNLAEELTRESWDWERDDTYLARNAFRRAFGFAIPTPYAIDVLRTYSPLVDCGAGTGFLSALLAQGGADVLAFDHPKPAYRLRKGHWYPVKLCGELGRFYARERTPLLSWPPYAEPFALHVAETVKPGKALAYIGESEGGCTGDDAFHSLLASAFELERDVPLPQWPGLHDALYIYRRKG
jgi:hypothetical protein